MNDPETARDLLLELETAYRLVQDKRFTVTYEPTPGGTSRRPDFAVRYTTRLEAMVEVTRLRKPLEASDEPGPAHGAWSSRLAKVLTLKLGQLTMHLPNVLVIGTDVPGPSEKQLSALLKELKRSVESGSEEALTRAGFKSRGDYLRRWASLSALVLLAAPDVDVDAAGTVRAPTWWHNPEGRYPLPHEVRSALAGALT